MLAEGAPNWPKQWKAEGYEEGRASGLKEGQVKGQLKGQLEGQLEGQRLALAEQAKEKFGGLEARFMGLIAQAPGDQLRQWFKNILTATTPGDLFRS